MPRRTPACVEITSAGKQRTKGNAGLEKTNSFQKVNVSYSTHARLTTVLLLLLVSLVVRGQSHQPVVSYTLTIDPANLSRFRVEMKILNAPDTLRLAFARHPEYDEQFWKNLKDLTVESGGKQVPVVREDSTLWRAIVPKKNILVRYRFELANQSGQTRRSWRIFLSETGGLVGGGQTFLYLVGHENLPARVTMSIPAGWDIATGLAQTADPKTFAASNVDELVDSPLLLGTLHTWKFGVDGVPHRVVYWPLPDAVPFDTTALVNSIEQIVRSAAAIFGRPPYRDYVFLLQDGAGDALEHLNSLTLGASSAMLALNPRSFVNEIAHEFFHTWNLVRIRPKEQSFVTYKRTTPTPALWWSEGVTIYFANKLLRRAGITDSAAMIRALTAYVTAYIQNTGNSRISPEHASLTANDPDPADSGYTASYYTQGMLIGQLLDIAIRDSTDFRKGLDDVMKAMFRKFPRSTGFTDEDLERTASQVGGCDLHQFFEDHIRGTHPLELEASLLSIGLRAVISRAPAADSAGNPLPDLRVFSFMPEEDHHVRIQIYSAPTAWWRAGLRTGDDVLAINGREINRAQDFREILSRQKLGDTVTVDYLRAGQKSRTTVYLTAYERVRVELTQIPDPTPRQQEMFARWIAGTL